jgi:hypothetical protein
MSYSTHIFIIYSGDQALHHPKRRWSELRATIAGIVPLAGFFAEAES